MYDSKDDILRIVPSSEPAIIQEYLRDYLISLQNKIDQYKTDLSTQIVSYPTTLPSLEIMDERLTEFVRLHHCDLL